MEADGITRIYASNYANGTALRIWEVFPQNTLAGRGLEGRPAADVLMRQDVRCVSWLPPITSNDGGENRVEWGVYIQRKRVGAMDHAHVPYADQHQELVRGVEQFLGHTGLTILIG